MNAAFQRADKNKAMAQMKDIETAIRNYYQKHNRMPTYNQNGRADALFGGQNLADKQCSLMYVLRAMPHSTFNPDHSQNKGQQLYLDISKESLVGKASLTGDSASYTEADNYYLDPWENPYYIVMDTSRDEGIDRGAFDLIPYAEVRTAINAASPGGDGTFPGLKIGVMSFGSEPGKAKSFIKSW
ncbi:MAG: hypothetical protein A2X46_11965 [Lentisphaerae bacterium GWF2_57_35]|nr:MAG: hypothetical protein A2X46_11965 [Lentisphaerae bacterium GWF2_57_35]